MKYFTIIALFVLGAIFIFPDTVEAGKFRKAVPADLKQCTEQGDNLICEHHFSGGSIGALALAEDRCSNLVFELKEPNSNEDAVAPLYLNEGFCKEKNAKALVVVLPHVKQETLFEIRISSWWGTTNIETGLEEKQTKPWKIVSVMVYPKNMMAPLRALAEKNTLVLYDKNKELGDFLDDHNIPHIEGLGTLFGKPIGLFVGYDDPDPYLKDSSLQSAVVFLEKSIDLPQMRVMSLDKKTRVYVEMQLMPKLADSPLAQKAFIKSIQQSLETAPVAKTEAAE